MNAATAEGISTSSRSEIHSSLTLGLANVNGLNCKNFD